MLGPLGSKRAVKNISSPKRIENQNLHRRASSQNRTNHPVIAKRRWERTAPCTLPFLCTHVSARLMLDRCYEEMSAEDVTRGLLVWDDGLYGCGRALHSECFGNWSKSLVRHRALESHLFVSLANSRRSREKVAEQQSHVSSAEALGPPLPPMEPGRAR